MRTKEAKDFLVQQTAEQAALKGISLSDLEKRMMYFVENDPISCADPLELNQEFEQKCDTEEYETKIASLLHDAYKRLKTEDSDKARQWDLAIRTLMVSATYGTVGRLAVTSSPVISKVKELRTGVKEPRSG